MSELVATCPRCGAQKTTFDVLMDTVVQSRSGVFRGSSQTIYTAEVFCVCRHCHRSTTFRLRTGSQMFDLAKVRLAQYKMNINAACDFEDFLSLKDQAAEPPPEHLPDTIGPVFAEGATCLAVGCFNAAGTMFRLCVDLATLGLLPPVPAPGEEPSPGGPNHKQRRDLGPRLEWLFTNGLLPQGLHTLASCIQQDGNDSAHRGTLTRDDAEDLLDFTAALLKRLYTEPQRLKLAEGRRAARREAGKP